MIKALRTACAALLFLLSVLPVIAALSAPGTLSVTSLKATSCTLTWTAATGGSGGVAGYNVYRDGALIGSTTTARTFAVAGLSPSSTYQLTVSARDGAGNISPASAALAVTTPADTTAPTRPADLMATNLGSTSFTLTWTEATDNVGVTAYNVYRGSALLGSSNNVSFAVTGLAPDSTNNITVRATDAAGNLSAASVALAVHTLADPPSVPSGLAATSLKATSFTLTWAASTGGSGGIVGYDVFQNGQLIGSATTSRTLAVAGLLPNTVYSMAVASRDAAGNVSPASVPLVVNTPADTTVPTRPSGPVASDITTTSFTLAWTGSTDNVGVTGYNIYRSGVLLGSVSTTAYVVTGMIPDSSNNMTVRAVDAAGNLSVASIALAVRMLAVPPSIPIGLAVTNLRPASFKLTWAASTGGTGGIVGYNVYLNATPVGTPTTRSLSLTGLTPATSYTVTVVSRDSAGNVSDPSEPLVVTTPADTTAPTVPKGLSADAVTYNSFNLTWTASTDNVRVVSYDVYRNNVLIGNTSNPVFSVTGLAPATISSMRVKARDAAGNISGYSAILNVTTSAKPNVPPVVMLTTLVDGSTFTLPFTLTLSAAAADSDGSIAKVEFFDGTTKLGEATVPSAADTFTLALSSGLPAGNHSLSARATDNQNATTDSAPVLVTVNNPNRFPTVMLSADITSTTAPGFITLTAESADGDGTIAKVEFYEGNNLLGEVLTPTAPFTFPLTLYSVGTYAITAVATDNSAAQTTSAPVVINVQSGAVALPFVANFEPTEGYHTGALNGQLSWIATGGVSVVTSTTAGSGQELSIPATQPNEVYSHDFSAAGISPVFVDFQARPVAGIDPASAVIFSTPAAQIALVGTTSSAQLWVFGGGVGWYATAQTIPIDADGRTTNWIRLTTREDYVAKKWDAYLEGKMIAADVTFADATATSLTDFSVNGHATTPSSFDSFIAGPEDPLFADMNHNGLDDVWETTHGLSLANDNRQTSPTGNGVTVLQAYLNGTDPNDFYNGAAPVITIVSGDNQSAAPGQFDVQPLVVAIKNATGTPLVNAPVTFSVQFGDGQLALANTGSPSLAGTLNLHTDSSGTAQVYYQQPIATNAQSAIQVSAGLAQVTISSTSTNGGGGPGGDSGGGSGTGSGPVTDADNNGLPDGWEELYFGHIGNNPNSDPLGVGRTLLQSYQLGLNPTSTGQLNAQAVQLAPASAGYQILATSPLGIVLLRNSQNYALWKNGQLSVIFSSSSPDYYEKVFMSRNGNVVLQRSSFTEIPGGGFTKSSYDLWIYTTTLDYRLSDGTSGTYTPDITLSPGDDEIFRDAEYQTADVGGIDDAGDIWVGLIPKDSPEGVYKMNLKSLAKTLTSYAPWSFPIVNSNGHTIGLGQSIVGLFFPMVDEIPVPYWPLAINDNGTILGKTYLDGQDIYSVYFSDGRSVPVPDILTEYPGGYYLTLDAQDRLYGFDHGDFSQPSVWTLQREPNGQLSTPPAYQRLTYHPLNLLERWTSALQAPDDGWSVLTGLGTNKDGTQANVPIIVLQLGELAVDADRNGVISLVSENDTDGTTTDKPYRFWLNDDDGGDNIPLGVGKGNGVRVSVNGPADLVNYFPVFLNIAGLLKALPPSDGYRYILSQENSALNFIYTNLAVDHAFDYLRPPRPKPATGTPAFQIKPLTTGFGYDDFTGTLNWLGPQDAKKVVVTATGVPLLAKWLNTITPENKLGVLLFDGRALTEKPLVLTVVDRNNVTLAEILLPLVIGNVEDMYRHLNLRQGSDVRTSLVDAGSSDAGRPSNYAVNPPGFPDTYNNKDWVLQMHGYNVTGEKARSWESAVFKNLYWSHSHAKFVGVCWLGDPKDPLWGSLPNYHAGARNAMLLAPSLARVINENFTGGKVTTITHSQSCMMVGTALADTDAKIDHAIFVDGALAQECYDGANDENLHDMTVSTWADTDQNTDATMPRYNRELWATDWWKYFLRNPDDARGRLTWQNRFRDPLNKIYNFYSPTENVLAKDSRDAGWVIADMAANIVTTLGGDMGHFSWVAQEKTKGNYIPVGPVASGSYYMGWGVNLADPPPGSDFPTWYDPVQNFTYRQVKAKDEVAAIYGTFKQIDIWPLFMTGWGFYPPFAGNPPKYDWQPADPSVPDWILYLYSDDLGSRMAREHRDQLLCEAIPALSLPVGANRVRVFSPDGPDEVSNRNFNIPLLFVDPEHWPRGRDSEGEKLPIWFHGDMHDQAYVYTYGFYDKLASIISQ